MYMHVGVVFGGTIHMQSFKMLQAQSEEGGAALGAWSRDK